MSIPVALPTLADTMARYGFAYLLTSTDGGGAPHAVAVTPVLRGEALVIGDLGRRSRSNIGPRPAVALVWPPKDEGDYSLIVDGQAAVEGDRVRISPTRAVLHRPAPPAAAGGTGASVAVGASGGCSADCVELDPGVGRRG